MGMLGSTVSELMRTFSGALDAIRPGDDLIEQLEGMNDAGVVRVLDQLGALQQVLDVVSARVMGSVSKRSRGGIVDHDPLARSHGYATPAVMLSERWRISRGRAATITAVGEAITPHRDFLGDYTECRYPEIAAAIEPRIAADTLPDHLECGAGPAITDHDADAPSIADDADADTTYLPAALSIDGAGIFLRELRLVGRGASSEQRAAAVTVGIEHCAGAPLSEVSALSKRVRMSLDQDGPIPRETALRRQQRCTLRELPDGMTELRAYLAPEAAGWIRAGIDALVGKQLRQVRFVDATSTSSVTDGGSANGSGSAAGGGSVTGGGSATGGGAAGRGDSATGEGWASSADADALPSADPFNDNYVPSAELPDTRTMEQRRVDALVDIFRHTGGCNTAVTELAPVSLVVRIDKADLLDDSAWSDGVAFIDGVSEPITAGAARRMAADGRVIPAVLDGPSQVLDLGVGTRLFSKAQKLALAERDGGCAWSGCTHPPSYTEAHHLEWWSRGGTTDLSNGILLCSFHHHRIHNDGWNVVVRDHVPWFIPPAHVDARRVPRRGGRPRLAA